MSDYPHIASRHNPLVRRFREAAEAATGEVLLDGEHLVAEALTGGVPLDTLAVLSDPGLEVRRQLAGRASAAGARVVTVTAAVLTAMSPVRQPSGMVALARLEAVDLETILAAPAPIVLVLAGVQDPGNVGSIVRAAEALGATGMICTEGTADAHGWKALRGSMGSALRLPIAVRQSLAAVAGRLRQRDIRIVAMVPRGGTLLDAADLRPPMALLLGGEGAGLEAPARQAADLTVSIPMAPAVESLNVAAAAALVLYEAARQRSRP